MSDEESTGRRSPSPSSTSDTGQPETQQALRGISFTIQLTKYKSVAKLGKNGKSTTKLEKETTQKEVNHALQDTRDGYLSFLRCILNRYNIRKGLRDRRREHI